ncbi:MAG: glycosyltransferase family 39 protein [Pseudomonadota bacterium]
MKIEAETPLRSGPKEGTPARDFNMVVLLACLLTCMTLRLHLALTYEVNWDEFLNLSMVYDYLRGDLQEPLQTLFVHAFRWAPAVSTNEVDQIVAARVVMFACTAATTVCIVAVARRFMSWHAAMFAAFCFAAYSFTVRQGGSFRTDTMAACVLMAALWIIVARPRGTAWPILAGGLIGLAGMLTIKAIFYVPTIAAILLLALAGSGPARRPLRYGMIVAGTSMGTFALLFWLHAWSLDDPASAFSFLDRTTGKTLGLDDTVVLVRYLGAAVLYNPVVWIALVSGVLACLWRLWTGPRRVEAATLLSLGLPLLSLAVYSESYPYYHSFILAPAAVLCGAFLSRLNAAKASRLAVMGTLAVSIQFGVTYAGLLERDNRTQHLTLAVVHRMFAEPVPYIDRSSMVSSFPKTGFFLSDWGMLDYYREGEPLIARAIATDQPPFVLANRHMLEWQNLVPDRAGPAFLGLMRADIEALRAHYIPHWGWIYVAGKSFDDMAVGQARSFDIMVEGTYTIEAPGPVWLNGDVRHPGSHVTLDAGRHELRATVPGTVILRWGADLYRPRFPPPKAGLFTTF